MIKSRYITVILFTVFFPFAAFAQEQTAHRQSVDSISIFELMEAVEANTSYCIYTTIEESFNVKKQALEFSVDYLQKALAPMRYRVTIYGKQLFVLPEILLTTTLSSTLQREKTEEVSSSFHLVPIEKAVSENKVYEIGDKNNPSSEEMVELNGQVTNFRTGQNVPGVNIVLRKPWIAVVTDHDGYFTIKLPAGYNALEIKGLGVRETCRQFMLYGDGNVHIELEEDDHLLDEVVIVSDRLHNVKSTQLGVERFRPALLKNIPTAMGEVDLLKMLQTLPGVKTVGEASNGYNVRGGATDQNLLLLNNGTIYNPNHLFGLFTAFNSDMIKDAEFYKSSIPSRFGGRISSVLNITSKEADKEKFTGSAGIGLVTSKLNLEIPVMKEKTSILLSGRTTYSDWIMKMLPEKSGYRDGNAGFYDVGTVFSHTVNNHNKLNVYGYYSHDRFAFNDNVKYAYDNMNVSLIWRSVLSAKLTGNFSFGYDHYDYLNDETAEDAAAARLSFDINQWFGKVDFSYSINDKHLLNFGVISQYYNINPGAYEPLHKESLVKKDVLQKDKALESAIYLGDEWKIASKLSVDVGVRYSIFNLLGPRTDYVYQKGMIPSSSSFIDVAAVNTGKIAKTYQGPEFRCAARYAFTDVLSLKAGFNTMRQYIHKISNTTIMSPTDTWKLSDPNIKPQRGWQVATGIYYNILKMGLELSMEGYYKKLSDYLDYRSAAKLLMNHHLETDVINTEGYAYGVELQVKKPSGKLNGWLSYTYSRTFLRQNDPRISRPVNNGEWYPAEYDKPHDFKLVGNYKFTRRYSMSFNVDYSTGRPTTVPAGQYYDKGLNAMQVYYTDRNSFRVPDYFRLDFSFNVEPSHHLVLLTHSSISIGIYNVTGRRNVYSVYYVSEGGKIQGYRMSIFGAPIPFITYNIKF